MSIKLGTLRHDIFEVQTGLKHSGHDPGPLDGYYGTLSAGAAKAMLAEGSKTGSRWAITEIGEGLRDLGWFDGDPHVGGAAEAIIAALGEFVAAGGVARASFVPKSDPYPHVGLDKPARKPAQTSRSIIQGSVAVTMLVLHTTATPGTWWRGKSVEDMLEEVYRWHVYGNGWNDVGYHRLYAPDGSKAEGRPENVIGAHVAGKNVGSLGWCMVPIRTINKMGHWSTYYTPEQINAVRRDIADLAERTPLQKLAGHNEFANKLCPGFEVVDDEFTDLEVA